METLSDDEIGSALCKLIQKVLPTTKLPPLRAVVVTRWFTNPYQRGVYSYRSPETDKQVQNSFLFPQSWVTSFGCMRQVQVHGSCKIEVTIICYAISLILSMTYV